MSDPDAAPDPIDKAYAEAEALLSDDGDRAARRARVLAAVAQATPEAATPTPRLGWRRGGWLVAASVGGLSVLLATQIRPPVSVNQPPATAPATPAVPSRETTDASPAADGSVEAAKRPARTSVPAPEAPAAAHDVAKIEPPAPPPPPPPMQPPPPPPPPPPPQLARARPEAPPAAAPAAPPAGQGVSEIVVTGSRIAPAQAAPRAAAYAAKPGGLAARLRDAAAGGLTAEVERLLARGAPVDAADDDGDTALMKSVQANHPAVAKILRRHGASLDRKNQAGESARDMATSLGDAELNRALGLGG